MTTAYRGGKDRLEKGELQSHAVPVRSYSEETLDNSHYTINQPATDTIMMYSNSKITKTCIVINT